MIKLYDILKAEKTGLSDSLFTALLAKKLSGPAATVKTLEGVPPLTFSAIGEPLIEWSIDGNMQQQGTPSSSSPIYPSETGERTENLLPELNLNTSSMGGIEFEKVNSYTIRAHGTMNGYSQCISTNGITLPAGTYFIMSYSTYSGSAFKAQARSQNGQTTYATNNSFTLTEETTVYPRIVTMATYTIPTDELITIMINRGSTALPFEPNGYKLPVVCGGVTTPYYLSEPIRKIGNFADIASDTGVTRYIKKLVLTGQESGWTDRPNYTYADRFVLQTTTIPNNSQLICSHFPVVYSSQQTYPYIWDNYDEQLIVNFSEKGTTTLAQFKAFLATQYQNGTPVAVWYTLTTAETETVTAPTISTIEGEQTFDVDTTLKPSEVTIEYMGW